MSSYFSVVIDPIQMRSLFGGLVNKYHISFFM